jgi:TetR/AcrR family transcriptional regulator
MSKNKLGRPTRQYAQDASNSIINAACLHFAQQGIKGTTNRQIAEEAKVTAAMVHYYFRNKEALYLGVLESAFNPLLSALAGVTSLKDWVTNFHAHLAERPWLPHLMIREVLPPNGQLRPIFLKHFAPQLFGSVKAMVAKEAASSNVAQDFDLERHIVLLMGMLVYPFMSIGITQYLTGRKYDEAMLIGFRDDALKLFCNGIAARA